MSYDPVEAYTMMLNERLVHTESMILTMVDSLSLMSFVIKIQEKTFTFLNKQGV